MDSADGEGKIYGGCLHWRKWNLVGRKRCKKLSAGALRVKVGDHYGVTRGRVLQDLPYEENFEGEFLLSIKARME